MENPVKNMNENVTGNMTKNIMEDRAEKMRENRIGLKFKHLAFSGHKALITFITAGDPTTKATFKYVRAMEQNGADIIELGVPYSDPIAEGPIIQAANCRALKNGIRTDDILALVRRLRKETEIPILLLLYFNSILQYGPKEFFSGCLKAGIDGVIIPDLPYEERDEISGVAEEYGIDMVGLVSSVSGPERIMKISAAAKGFLYCVSSLGVTGTRNSFATDFKAFFNVIDKYAKHAKIPTAIGFGISSPEQVKNLKGYADGLIVGSAIVKIISEAANEDEAAARIGAYTASLRAALDS